MVWRVRLEVANNYGPLPRFGLMWNDRVCLCRGIIPRYVTEERRYIQQPTAANLHYTAVELLYSVYNTI